MTYNVYARLRTQERVSLHGTRELEFYAAYVLSNTSLQLSHSILPDPRPNYPSVEVESTTHNIVSGYGLNRRFCTDPCRSD